MLFMCQQSASLGSNYPNQFEVFYFLENKNK